MNLVKLMLAIITIGFSPNSSAISGIIYADENPCGSWVKLHDPSTKSLRKYEVDAWLSGYLTGVADESKIDFLVGTDANSVFLWMTNYCRQNPLSQVSAGVMILVKELKAKTH